MDRMSPDEILIVRSLHEVMNALLDVAGVSDGHMRIFAGHLDVERIDWRRRGKTPDCAEMPCCLPACLPR